MRTYFMGIGGSAMANVALLAKQMGDTVLGSDGPLYPPASDMVAGMEVYEGYSAERLAKLAPDTVVIGNSIGRGNAELEWFWQNKPCAYASMPQFLYERILQYRPTIAVCGTHGKTTTTTLTAFLLKNNNANPGWLIGGLPQALPSGSELGGANTHFVIEGDEYDTAFFDKRAKFISYQPRVAVLNNLEADHLDIYRDIEDLKRSFNHLLRTIPANGLVIANGDDENLRALLPVSWVKTLWVGTGAHNDLVIKNFSETSAGSSFELHFGGQLWRSISWNLNGLFNARNAAMAALAAGWSLNPANPTAINLNSLADFVGVKRRQEVRYQSNNLVVVEDFAHHPTAVALTLQSMRNRFPGRQWIACLEPRSNTSRTNAHQETFPVSLLNADLSFIAPVHNAASLPEAKRLNVAKVAADVTTMGKAAVALKSCAELPVLLNRVIADADQPLGVVFFSNGTFEGAMEQFLTQLPQVVTTA